jgi:type VI secretion system protein ImpA
MAYFAHLRASAAPLAADAADLDSDAAMQSFYAVTEGSLPVSFRDFDRKAFDDRAIIAELTRFLERSRDVRLLTLAAKVFALAEDFHGFLETIELIAGLLDAHWDEVPPQPRDGGVELRSAYLQSLEDMPTVLLPLQQAPLVKDRQLGPISLRTLLVARKQMPARRDETVASEQAIIGAMRRHEPASDLAELHRAVTAALAGLERIRAAFIAHDGYQSAPSVTKLVDLLVNIAAVLAEAGAAPAAETAGQAAATAGDSADTSSPAITPVPAIRSSRVGSAADAAAALAAVAAYYQASEPSSLAFLLVRQSQQLIGKSFVEAMQVLAPNQSGDIRIGMGRDSGITLTFSLLENLVPPRPDDEAAPYATAAFEVADRAAASELMIDVERYFHAAEPSSPIPLLLERARQFVSRDFASVLEELTKREE